MKNHANFVHAGITIRNTDNQSFEAKNYDFQTL